MTRELPIPRELLVRLAEEHGTPLYVYDAATIRARAAELARYDVVRYAQKANPNLAILKLVREQLVTVDAVSPGEVLRAVLAGFPADEIAYTADVFDARALEAVTSLPVRVNCGSLDMLPLFAAARRGALAELEQQRSTRKAPGARLDPARAAVEGKRARPSPAQRAADSHLMDVTLRINPGFGHGHDPRVATGGASSKHGIWHADLPRAIELAGQLGLRVVGLHVHVGSGSDLANLTRAASLFELAARLVRPTLRTLSAGGGLPIPYRDEDPHFDVRGHFEAWNATRERVSAIAGRRIELEVEPGRFLVAESGVLVTRVLGTKRNGDVDFALADAGFHTLLRPAMYGAYHRIESLTAAGPPRPTVVAGPLCESGNVFTRTSTGQLDPRPLPALARGDLLAIRDAGAYGMSMASRYNSQPFPAEVLVDAGAARVIRKRETFEDLLAHERLD